MSGATSTAPPVLPPAAPSGAALESPQGTVTENVNFAYHVVIGVAIGLVSLITALAWPFAILTGAIIGQSEVDRMLGRPSRRLVRVLAVTGGVLAMLFFGAFFGGLLAFMVVALMAYSERISARANNTDRQMARLVTVLVAVVTWLVAVLILKPNINISIG